MDPLAHGLPHLVEVRPHPARPGIDEMSFHEKLGFAALDTVYDLLREYAVRVTLESLRLSMEEAGEELLSPEKLFEEFEKNGYGKISFLDLAPDMGQVRNHLLSAFELLVRETGAMATAQFQPQAGKESE